MPIAFEAVTASRIRRQTFGEKSIGFSHCRVRPSVECYCMDRLSAPIRAFVVTGLICSLVATGIAPVWLSPSSAERGIGNLACKRTCCCGTVDGRCCGMACCKVAPPEKEQETPSVPHPRDDRAGSLYVTQSEQLPRVPSCAALLQAARAEVPASGSPSLVALRVQLNC